jgi:MFS family permease
MHQLVSTPLDMSRRWWVLAIVVAAQFMFGVDAFIVNVAIATIAVELRASSAQIEAVIAIYLIAYATLVVTGGRLGDIYGTRNVFIAGVLGFTVTSVPRRAGTRLDVPGAVVLFCGLLCLIGPLLFGHDLNWTPWLWLVMAAGVGIIATFLRLERAVASRGGMPLLDLALLSDRAFMRGLYAAFFFFFANLSFYLVVTMFMQKGLRIPPLQAGLVFVPLTLTFVVASRHSGARARHRGTKVLIEGCAVQIAGLAMLALTTVAVEAPGALLLAAVLAVFGYGQGLVMAPLSSVVLSSVKPASAGSGAGMYGTTSQIANASGVAAIGAVFFASEAAQSAEPAFLVALTLFALSIAASAAFLSWMRRAAI